MLDSQSYETLVEKLADEILDDGMEVQASDYYDTATNYDEEAYNDMYDYEKDAAVADYEMEILASIDENSPEYKKWQKIYEDSRAPKGMVPWVSPQARKAKALRYFKKKNSVTEVQPEKIYYRKNGTYTSASPARRATAPLRRAGGFVKRHPLAFGIPAAAVAAGGAGAGGYALYRRHKNKKQEEAEKAAAYYDEAQLIKEAAENIYYEADYYNDYDCELMKMAAEDAYDEAEAMEEAALNVADSLYDSYDDGYGYDDDYDYE